MKIFHKLNAKNKFSGSDKLNKLLDVIDISVIYTMTKNKKKKWKFLFYVHTTTNYSMISFCIWTKWIDVNFEYMWEHIEEVKTNGLIIEYLSKNIYNLTQNHCFVEQEVNKRGLSLKNITQSR